MGYKVVALEDRLALNKHRLDLWVLRDHREAGRREAVLPCQLADRRHSVPRRTHQVQAERGSNAPHVGPLSLRCPA